METGENTNGVMHEGAEEFTINDAQMARDIMALDVYSRTMVSAAEKARPSEILWHGTANFRDLD